MAGGVEDNRLPAAMFLPQLLLHCGVARKGGLEERLGVCLLLGAKVNNVFSNNQQRAFILLRALCNNKVAALRSAHQQQSTEYLTYDYQVPAQLIRAHEKRC